MTRARAAHPAASHAETQRLLERSLKDQPAVIRTLPERESRRDPLAERGRPRPQRVERATVPGSFAAGRTCRFMVPMRVNLRTLKLSLNANREGILGRSAAGPRPQRVERANVAGSIAAGRTYKFMVPMRVNLRTLKLSTNLKAIWGREVRNICENQRRSASKPSSAWFILHQSDTSPRIPPSAFMSACPGFSVFLARPFRDTSSRVPLRWRARPGHAARLQSPVRRHATLRHRTVQK
jgi:hypothetical protein